MCMCVLACMSVYVCVCVCVCVCVYMHMDACKHVPCTFVHVSVVHVNHVCIQNIMYVQDQHGKLTCYQAIQHLLPQLVHLLHSSLILHNGT